VTMSTNLGWPSEPEPEPEHRRLGWLSRMMNVSRETDETLSGDVVAAAVAADAQGDVIALETPADSPVTDDQVSPSTAVDNAVDEVPTTPAFEREIVASEAGDNPVDDGTRDTQEHDDRADRDALAAAIPTPGTDTPLGRELADNARRRIQLTGRQFPKPVSPRVLTVANQKGGVGKTTTTVNVAAALAQSGLKALVIDLDPQGNASTALGIDHHAEVPSIYDVLVDSTPLLDVVQPCNTVENLFCAPATIDLAGAEIELVSLVARESRLQKAIAAAGEAGHEFDYILIDCPPSLGLLTVNAMVAASEVFIPIQCEYYALEGLSQLLKNIDLIKRHLNPTLHVSTILLTMYDGRTRLSAQVADEVREHFPKEVLRTTVPRSVRVSEAPSFGETVMTYDPASSGALAYLEAAGELADRGAAGPT
jgi:cellulose biosynthesis protein BcsQ